MKKTIAATALTLSLILGSVTGVGAQQNTQPGSSNQAPGTTSQQQGPTGGTTTDNNNTLADWWWALPLLAIPVIYLMTRRREDESEYRNERFAGAKGGQSGRKREEDEL